MAKLEIYFDEFNYEYIRQDPAYTVGSLLPVWMEVLYPVIAVTSVWSQ